MYKAASEKRVSFEAIYESTTQFTRNTVPLREQLKVLKAEESLARNLSESQPELTILGYVSKAARGTNGTVYVNEFKLVRYPRQKSRQANGVLVSANVLKLQGTALDGIAIARFVTGIRESGLFDNVKLESKRKLGMGSRNVSQFDVVCTF